MDSLEKTFLRIQRSANLPAWFVLAIALVYIIPNCIRDRESEPIFPALGRTVCPRPLERSWPASHRRADSTRNSGNGTWSIPDREHRPPEWVVATVHSIDLVHYNVLLHRRPTDMSHGRRCNALDTPVSFETGEATSRIAPQISCRATRRPGGRGVWWLHGVCRPSALFREGHRAQPTRMDCHVCRRSQGLYPTIFRLASCRSDHRNIGPDY